MINVIVAQDGRALVQVVRGAAIWAAIPVAFWFMWTVLQPLMGRLMGAMGVILTGKFDDQN